MSTLCLISLLFTCLFVGVPIAFALGFSSLVTIMLFGND